MEFSQANRACKRGAGAEGVADSDDVHKRIRMDGYSAAPMRRTGKLVSGRTCVECGATQTPQWREGPAGEALELRFGSSGRFVQLTPMLTRCRAMRVPTCIGRRFYV